MVGSQTMMMPAKVTGGAVLRVRLLAGLPAGARGAAAHIKTSGIDDVVFITGDIHLFLAGDVRTNMGDGESVAVEFVGGSITSTNFGEMDIDAGGGMVIPGNDANPNTDPAIINALRAINPWVDQADFDHHGYALVEGLAQRLRVHAKRVETIKRRSRRLLTTNGFRYRAGARPEVDQGRERPATA